MKNIKVKLLHITPQEVLINAVAKPYKNEKASLKLVEKVGKVYKHHSILEHTTINFEVLGISRLCLQELARHRVCSYTVESTRFTLDKILNDNIVLTENNISDYVVVPTKFETEDYVNVLDAYNKNNIEKLNEIVYHKNNNELPNDELKYFLPENWRVNLNWSINLRALTNFLNLREPKNAHFEIRHLANLVRQEVEKTYAKDLI